MGSIFCIFKLETVSTKPTKFNPLEFLESLLFLLDLSALFFPFALSAAPEPSPIQEDTITESIKIYMRWLTTQGTMSKPWYPS